jgi:hypothetical protein
MSFFTYLKKHNAIRKALIITIIILILPYLATIVLSNCITLNWRRLPPLPNGETARDFTDVLARNRINIVTNQGRYYSCPYEVEEQCWIPIPREVNSPQSKYPEYMYPPKVPSGTQKAVATYGAHGEDSILVIATIQNDGQVMIGTSLYDNFKDTLYFLSGCIYGIACLIGIFVLAIITPSNNQLN